MKRGHGHIALMGVLLFTLAASGQTDFWLRCSGPGKTPSVIEARSVAESESLHLSPHGAERMGKYSLVVRWQNGTHAFRDKPPYTASLDGIHWTYCGYNPDLGLHLLREQHIDLFTGVLLNDGTGIVLPAGEEVLFSPDRRWYAAWEQPDGQDGETLKLYSSGGHLLWKGYSGLLSADGQSVAAEFAEFHWDAQNRLTAQTAGHQNRPYVLSPSGSGTWKWVPRR